MDESDKQIICQEESSSESFLVSTDQKPVAENSHIKRKQDLSKEANNDRLNAKSDSSSDNETQEGKRRKWNELHQLSSALEVPPNLSKRQQKKFVKKMLWETKWKPMRRAKEKEKLKQKKVEARLNHQSLGPSRKLLKSHTMATSNCKLKIALDFSFDNLMNEKDIGKCLKQLNHCYCLNRRTANPLQFYVTNFNGLSQHLMTKVTGYLNWDVNFHTKSYLDVFKKEELVYLTSDSENVLSALDESKVYIIGAFVDHNKYKGKTLSVAQTQGISHAQLPIGEYLQMNSRKVLTIDHVFEILIHKTEGYSWKEAFLKVIPQRKGAVEKNLDAIASQIDRKQEDETQTLSLEKLQRNEILTDSMLSIQTDSADVL